MSNSNRESPAMAAPTADAITKASKSNLALAFVALPPGRRRDITTFYAFCRIVDDIADGTDLPLDERQRRLDLWRESLADEFAGEPALAPALRKLMRKYMISRSYFEEILSGVEMDLAPREYQTFADLWQYCYRVASAVGLVSIEIFGYHHPRCKEYAVDLGLALQLTNIIRDVGEDFANGGRIYLPREDLAKFGYTPQDIAGRVRDDRFLRLMEFEAARALEYYQKAEAELPPEDRRPMVPARIMAAVYGRLLKKMRAGGFRVFEKRYSLSPLRKAAIVGRYSLMALAAGRFPDAP